MSLNDLDISKLKYINTKGLPDIILKLCTVDKGCYYSTNKKKILLTDENFIQELKSQLSIQINKRTQLFTLSYWYRKYEKKVENYFNLPIVFYDCREEAMIQIDDAYNNEEFDFSHWEEYLDFHIRLAALIASWGDYTKDNFKNFSKDKIEEELFNMERRNYDIAIVKEIMNKE